jgi:hypothetical protein
MVVPAKPSTRHAVLPRLLLPVHLSIFWRPHDFEPALESPTFRRMVLLSSVPQLTTESESERAIVVIDACMSLYFGDFLHQCLHPGD